MLIILEPKIKKICERPFIDREKYQKYKNTNQSNSISLFLFKFICTSFFFGLCFFLLDPLIMFIVFHLESGLGENFLSEFFFQTRPENNFLTFQYCYLKVGGLKYSQLNLFTT